MQVPGILSNFFLPFQPKRMTYYAYLHISLTRLTENQLKTKLHIPFLPLALGLTEWISH